MFRCALREWTGVAVTVNRVGYAVFETATGRDVCLIPAVSAPFPIPAWGEFGTGWLSTTPLPYRPTTADHSATLAVTASYTDANGKSGEVSGSAEVR